MPGMVILALQAFLFLAGQWPPIGSLIELNPRQIVQDLASVNRLEASWSTIQEHLLPPNGKSVQARCVYGFHTTFVKSI